MSQRSSGDILRRRRRFLFLGVWLGTCAAGAALVGAFHLSGPTTLAASIVIAIGTVLVSVRRRRRVLERYISDAEGIHAAVARGELKAARAFYSARAEAPFRDEIVSTVARHGLAYLHMREGDHARAIEIAIDNDASHRKAMQHACMRKRSAIYLALYHALAGDTVEAARVLAGVERRSDVVQRRDTTTLRVLVQAVIDARRGRPDIAVKLLDDHRAECETALEPTMLRVSRVVRAFAIASAGPRDAALADAAAATAKPLIYPGEYRFLGASWGEMAAFLATHELA